jgi:hypothetical protein
MTTRRIAGGLLLSAAAAAGCWNGATRAPLAPVTDITLTSAQAYAAQPQYLVTEQHRCGAELVMRVNVIDTGRAASIARQAIEASRDGASRVVAYLYGPDGRPSEAPWRTLIWAASSGYSGLLGGQTRGKPAADDQGRYASPCTTETMTATNVAARRASAMIR